MAIAERFEKYGFTVKDFAEKCDIYVINTCAVTAESSRKSYQMIRRAIGANPLAVIAAVGCQSQLDAEQTAKLKGVDIICGTNNKLSAAEKAAELFYKGVKYPEPLILADTFIINGASFEPMTVTRQERTRAYVKIQDGCNNKCSYCVIPKIRGDLREKPAEIVTGEIQSLADNGYKEIVLTGIETSAYKNITELIRNVNKIEGIERIRLSSLDPSFITPSVSDELLAVPKFMPHFHLSVQSGSSEILRSMRRKYNAETALNNIGYIKKVNPAVNFSADIMTGYPNETLDNFNETLEFIKTVKFLHIHAFTYSRRPGTEAAAMPNQIPEPEKIRRAALLMQMQNEIKYNLYKTASESSESLNVLFENYADNKASGHTPDFFEVEIKSLYDIRGELSDVKPIGVTSVKNIKNIKITGVRK